MNYLGAQQFLSQICSMCCVMFDVPDLDLCNILNQGETKYFLWVISDIFNDFLKFILGGSRSYTVTGKASYILSLRYFHNPVLKSLFYFWILLNFTLLWESLSLFPIPQNPKIHPQLKLIGMSGILNRFI